MLERTVVDSAFLRDLVRETILEFFQDAAARGRGDDGIYGRRESALAELERLRAALVRCAELAGEDGEAVGAARSGALKQPPLSEWAVLCVQSLRADYDDACSEVFHVNISIAERERDLAEVEPRRLLAEARAVRLETALREARLRAGGCPGAIAVIDAALSPPPSKGAR